MINQSFPPEMFLIAFTNAHLSNFFNKCFCLVCDKIDVLGCAHMLIMIFVGGSKSDKSTLDIGSFVKTEI